MDMAPIEPNNWINEFQLRLVKPNFLFMVNY